VGTEAKAWVQPLDEIKASAFHEEQDPRIILLNAVQIHFALVSD
jgi:hypothetical protein